MSNLCIQVEDYVSPFAGQLPVVQTEDLIYIEKYEEDAFGHWAFGVNADSLKDKVNNRMLTVQAGSTVLPVYTENTINVSAAKGNALQSTLLDNTAFTMAAVVKPDTTALTIIMGTLGGNDILSGLGLFVGSDGKIYLTARGGVSSVFMNFTIDNTKPAFLSLSFNPAAQQYAFVALQNDVMYEKTGISALTPSNLPLGFGNVQYTTSTAFNSIKQKFYEGILYNKALTAAELKNVAMRAKVRQEHHGVIF